MRKLKHDELTNIPKGALMVIETPASTYIGRMGIIDEKKNELCLDYAFFHSCTVDYWPIRFLTKSFFDYYRINDYHYFLVENDEHWLARYRNLKKAYYKEIKTLNLKKSVRFGKFAWQIDINNKIWDY